MGVLTVSAFTSLEARIITFCSLAGAPVENQEYNSLLVALHYCISMLHTFTIFFNHNFNFEH